MSTFVENKRIDVAIVDADSASVVCRRPERVSMLLTDGTDVEVETKYVNDRIEMSASVKLTGVLRLYY